MPGQSPDQPRRVLIVRPTALGDVSRTVPALVMLRRSLPDARIDWLVQDDFADVIRHHPALNNVVPFPRGRFGKMWLNPKALGEFMQWSRDLRKTAYDMVIDLQGLFRSGYFAWKTGASRRVGYNNARELGWFGYNERYPINASLHTVDRMIALVAAAGFPSPLDEPPDMRLYIGADDRRWLDDCLKENNATNEPFFTVAPTARWRSKCWPIERYIDITRRLLDTGVAGRRVIVLSSPKERPQVQPLLDAFTVSASSKGPKPILISPATSVGQMMAVLERTSLLVCNDSAPLHIAVGFNRPIVAIFGPTDPSQVGPYRREDCVVRPPGVVGFHRDRDDQSLIASVRDESVWQAIERAMSSPR